MNAAVVIPLQDLQDLIRKLLVVSPARRLGVLKSGAAGVREHPWFAGFDWAAFAERKLPAPYIPKVSASHPSCM